MKPKVNRNEEIVALHDHDPIKYSFGNLAKKYRNSKTKKPLSKQTIYEIYIREKARRGNKSALNSSLVKNKYPQFLKRKELSTV
ncbi:MAG: hypothetical protein KJI72_00285 [Patescibacteria group bacterium]|nr:hypothetical protein [Patescibacteria group bacterium]